MAPIKIGIVGTGSMAGEHAARYQQVRGASLHACMDLVPERAAAFAEKHGFRHHVTSVDDVLNEVDAVSIVTRDDGHVPIAVKAVKAGVHVLCEKPLALSLADARRLMKVYLPARRKGLVGMINFSHRAGHFYAAQDLVRKGRLGELRYVRSNYLQGWISSDYWGNWASDTWIWRLQTALGSMGALGDIGCHVLDFTTGVAGPIEKLRCMLSTHPKVLPSGRRVTKRAGHDLDSNDTAIVELIYENGASGLTDVTRWATGVPNSVNLEVYGTEGALMCGHGNTTQGTYMRVCLGEKRHVSEWQEHRYKVAPDNWDRFIKAIRTGEHPQPDLLRGAEIQGYLDAGERSAKSGAFEKIRKFD